MPPFPTNNVYNTATQTTVPLKPDVGAPGLLYDPSDDNDIVSLICATAIPFGAFCFMSADGFASVPAATGNVTAPNAAQRGIAVIDHNKYSGEGYDIGDTVRFLRRGRIWALTDPTISILISSPLFVRFAAGAGGTVLGSFGLVADTATASSPPVAMSVFHGGGANRVVLDLS
jgi:hypothetical protein